MSKRPSVQDGHCAKCGSGNLTSWRNDHVVICEHCGTNHAWPRSGQFFRGYDERDGNDERDVGESIAWARRNA